MKILLRSSVLLFLVIGLAGCTQYAPLERSNTPTAIALPPILNEAGLPQLIAPLARNVREKLAHSPNWELVSPEQAEAQLQLTIVDVQRRAMANDPIDAGRPISFYEVIRVTAEWIGNGPAPWGAPNKITVESDQLLYTQPSLVDAQHSATAELAENLADKILQQLDWAK